MRTSWTGLKPTVITVMAVVVAFATLAARPMSAQDGTGDAGVTFTRDIAPILLSQCQGCHGPKKAKGSYRVDSFNRLVKGSDPDWPGITAKKLDKSEAFSQFFKCPTS